MLPRAGQIFVIFVCSLFWLPLGFEIYLKIRNISTLYDIVSIPKVLRSHYDEHKFELGRWSQYHVDKDLMHLVPLIYYAILVTITILGGFMPMLWKLSILIADYWDLEGEAVQSLVMMFIVTTAYSVLEIPPICFTALQNETVNNMFVKLIDLFFFYILLLIAAVMTTPVVYFVVQKGFGALLLILLGIVISINYMQRVIYDDYMYSMAEQHEDLQNIQLKNDLIKLANQLKFQPDRVFVAKSSDVGAYFTGLFGNGRIILQEPLLYCSAYCRNHSYKCSDYMPCPDKNETEQYVIDSGTDIVFESRFTNEEIVAIVGHEFGHWSGRHNFVSILAQAIWTVLIWCIASLLFSRRYIFEVFCFYTVEPLVVGIFLVFTFICLPLDNFIWPFVNNYITRTQEYAADLYSSKAGYRVGLISSLSALHADMGACPMADYMYSMFKLDHPCLYERIIALEAD